MAFALAEYLEMCVGLVPCRLERIPHEAKYLEKGTALGQ
jgi:hypothetical protein